MAGDEQQQSSSSTLQVSGMDDAQESDVETYEGVTADEFHDFADYVVSAMNANIAASVVVVFALMLCAGIMAVDTLVRSLEG